MTLPVTTTLVCGANSSTPCGARFTVNTHAEEPQFRRVIPDQGTALLVSLSDRAVVLVCGDCYADVLVVPRALPDLSGLSDRGRQSDSDRKADV